MINADGEKKKGKQEDKQMGLRDTIMDQDNSYKPPFLGTASIVPDRLERSQLRNIFPLLPGLFF